MLHAYRQKSLKYAVLFTATLADLSGCTLGSYPTKYDVSQTVPNIPNLETVSEGRGYIAVVRDAMVAERNYLQTIDYGLDAGIVGGLVTSALGTALKWSSHTTIRSGIFSGAAIGISSALSLKQQEQLFNKGLDALVCVEAGAETAYISVRAYDAVLEPIAEDLDQLSTAIVELQPEAKTDHVLKANIGLAFADYLNYKRWLAVKATPTEDVNAAIKIAVDATLQATIDQLNSSLPDGSAFAKISLTPPPASAPPSVPPPQPSLTILRMAGSNRPGTAIPPADPSARLLGLTTQLQNDAATALQLLPGITPPAATQLPAINCPLSNANLAAAILPFQVLPPSVIMHISDPPFPLAIIGGTPPYSLQVSAVSGQTNPTPQYVGVPKSISVNAVTITNQAGLQPGSYTLTITDTAGKVISVSITEVK